MNHLKKYITIYNPLYTAVTTVCTSGLILISNGTIATTIVVVIAIGIHTIVNKGKDKLSELDESSPIGKLKKQNEEYKIDILPDLKDGDSSCETLMSERKNIQC